MQNLSLLPFESILKGCTQSEPASSTHATVSIKLCINFLVEIISVFHVENWKRWTVNEIDNILHDVVALNGTNYNTSILENRLEELPGKSWPRKVENDKTESFSQSNSLVKSLETSWNNILLFRISINDT